MTPARLTLLFPLILLLFPGSRLPLSAETPAAESLFYQANILVGEDAFDEAIPLYEAALAQKPSVNIHYNLGHAYYQTGDWGRARIHWEKTLAMAPRHAAARHNLERLLEEQNLPAFASFPGAAFFRFLSLNQWIWTGVAGFWVVLGGILAARWKKAPRFLALGALGAIPLLAGMAALLFVSPRFNDAILVEDRVPLRVAPAPDGPVTATLPAAQPIRIVGSHDPFMRVRLPDGRKGFIEAGALERIR